MSRQVRSRRVAEVPNREAPYAAWELRTAQGELFATLSTERNAWRFRWIAHEFGQLPAAWLPLSVVGTWRAITW